MATEKLPAPGWVAMAVGENARTTGLGKEIYDMGTEWGIYTRFGSEIAGKMPSCPIMPRITGAM